MISVMRGNRSSRMAFARGLPGEHMTNGQVGETWPLVGDMKVVSVQ